MNYSKFLTRFGAVLLASVFGALQLSAQTGQSSSVDTASDSGVSPAPTGIGSDNENFQADLYTGRFTYSVPIIVPPGRQGAQPKLTLGYNSSGGNGWCGVGWLMDVGYIQRDTRRGVPVLWTSGPTNTSYSAQYDDSKGFIGNFGGVSSPLVLVSATNAYPLVYRQQVETAFLTYNYYSTSSNSYWQVIDKSGNTFYFGEGTTNQMENPQAGWTSGVGSSTFRWALDKVVDVNGNETLLNYETDAGMLYLTNIMYNANVNSPTLPATHEVDFILTTGRPDTNITFISGYRVTTRLLLGEVDTKVSGTNVSKYVLGYTNSPSTMRSLLASVTRYGSDFSSAMPPITFNYQVQPFKFGPTNFWGGVNTLGIGSGNNDWNALRFMDSGGATRVEMVDMDGDGLPDRVIRNTGGNPYTNFFVQRNLGSSFAPATTNYLWGTLNSQGQPNDDGLNSPTAISITENETHVDFIDINGDGYPDRVMRDANQPWTNFWVQLNTGLASLTNSFVASDQAWTNVVDTEVSSNNSGNVQWFCPRAKQSVDMVDMNGDGLPDRVTRKVNTPFNAFKVQLNNGNGFAEPALWTNVVTFSQTDNNFNSISSKDGNNNERVILMDINGDGLPDRLMASNNPPVNVLWVQYNNGHGFEPQEVFGVINTQGNDNDGKWGDPIGTDGSLVRATLVDINGDGLPDRVMRQYSAAGGPYTNWWVQINTGSGFGPTNLWGPIDSQGQPNNEGWTSISDKGSGDTVVDFFDINGDGLPDRVMRPTSANAPYDKFIVQTNEGPFPDLMCTVSNGLGGGTTISYVASTTLDNRNTNWVTDPWAEGARSLLSFNVWVVSKVVSYDGMGNSSTNSYAFSGGYYNSAEREFRGFSQSTLIDSLGTTNISYFHQSGGRDYTAIGEYQDAGSESKKGIPFLIVTIGSDGKTNRVSLNKVQEAVLNANGWYFPYIAQTIIMNYEPLGSYRATATQFTYDTNSGNVLAEADLGEVTGVSFAGQTFTDASASDNTYKWLTYASLSNPYIVSKPSDIKLTSDSGGSVRLRESTISYDSRGNMTTNQVWLDTSSSFITKSITAYDQYGNPTSGTDAAGVTTATTYDSQYKEFPLQQITATFTNSYTFDAKSGLTITITDPKGLVASNSLDVFFRSVATYISTNAFGAAVLWKTKTSYSVGGISGGTTANYVYKQVNDSVDPVNGFQSYSYFDGLGRVIQTRAEAETGQYRVANTCYDARGNILFQTLPYFSSGGGFTSISGTYPGTFSEYDPVGRPFRVTPAVNGSFSSGSLGSTTATGGDTGSAVGPVTTAYVDGSNPWATVVTDPNSKVTKSYRDAHERVTNVVQVTSAGNYSTFYGYDRVGNLTNVTDNAGNQSSMTYDSLGRKTSVADPDSGTWSYGYDSASRITQQIDARTNTLTFSYGDALGRLTSKQIYNAGNQLVGTVTYTYDVSDDTNYTVLKGQLYKVTDLQGYRKNGYDVRGRVVKTGRHLNVNSVDYVTQTSYDDADRVVQLVYPNSSATVAYSYDTAGNLNQVRSLAGTGTQEIFYTPSGFNALGQITGYTNGNGVASTYSYFGNSARLQNLTTSVHATNIQNLSYTYDAASDVMSINDSVNSGTASASLSSVTYDDLYRLVSLNSTARGVKTYAYDSTGNILTNQDFGSGLYKYGAKPHAVTNANGVNYSYDACGNMIVRGSQALSYDEQNELASVSTTNGVVAFGYDENGQRLWRAGTNGYSVWIGEIYEINDGKVLCHVFAGDKRIATFEPICGGPWAKVTGEKRWYAAAIGFDKALIWPLQKLGAPLLMVLLTLAGMIGVCVAAGRQTGIRAARHYLRKNALYYRFVSILCICVFVFVSTDNVQATTYSPVFYYYHADDLGSSNVLTDRSGNIVQEYEYTSFGQTGYAANTSAYPVSNRYTGQIIDDQTGLYYYQSRYYDPQLGRFIQPDSMVPSVVNSQDLNRYSYCVNNPLKYVDPTGHFWGLAIIIGVIIGIVVGSATAAINHTNIWMGALTGAIGGLFGGFGSLLGTALDAALQGVLAGVVGFVAGAAVAAAFSAAGSVVTAELTGGDLELGAETGALSGAISFGTAKLSGYLDSEIKASVKNGALEQLESAGKSFALGAAGRALSNGVNAILQGKDPWLSAESGAELGAISTAARDLLTLDPDAKDTQLVGGQHITVPGALLLAFATGIMWANQPSKLLSFSNIKLLTDNRTFATATIDGKAFNATTTSGSGMSGHGGAGAFATTQPNGKQPIWAQQIPAGQGRNGPIDIRMQLLGSSAAAPAGETHGQ